MLLCHCRSTSRATPCHVPTWRRPRPGLPGRPSTSPTTAATTNNASDTLAKRASRTPACWRWAGRGSRCATAPAMAPRAAPPTVSAEWRRQMVSLWLSQPLDVSLLSPSNWLSVSLQASYWPPRLEPFLLSVCCPLDPSRSKFSPSPVFCPAKVAEGRRLNQLLCLRSRLPLLYQQIKAPSALMNSQIHKADYKDTNAHRCRCSNLNYSLAKEHKHSLLIRHPSYSPLHRAVSVSHTPCELNPVNVCTNRLLIDKLFMLSSGRIHIRG